jgi:hypothetical protein
VTVIACRSMPCSACPYRQDVAPGVWAEEEYDKLPPYDEPTGSQPMALFLCHATPEHACYGWAVVHSSRGHDRELLALRVFGIEPPEPHPSISLFSSGAEAAEHGVSDYTEETFATVVKLVSKHARLQGAHDG